MKNVIILLIIFFAVRYLRRYLAARHEGEAVIGAGKNSGADGEEMVLDPVCSSYIPISSALSVRNGDMREYFCGEGCRQKYIASLKR